MANAPIIQPSSGGGLTIGGTVTGGTAKYGLFVGADGTLADDIGFQYDKTVGDLTIGRDYIAGRDVRVTRYLGIHRGAESLANAIEIGDNSQAAPQIIAIHSATSQQQFVTFNSGGTEVWDIGKNVDDTYIWYAPNAIGHTMILDPVTGSLSMLKGAKAVASALLEMVSTSKGLLPPRMTATQRDAIGTPAEGLVIYNTSSHKLNLFTTGWEEVTSA